MVDYGLATYTVYSDKMDLAAEIKNSTLPLVLYFTAKWCGPCKIMGPMLEEKLEQNKNFRIIKIETDKHQELGMDYEIPGLPTFIVYHKGSKVDVFFGTKEDLIDKIYAKITSLGN